MSSANTFPRYNPRLIEAPPQGQGSSNDPPLHLTPQSPITVRNTPNNVLFITNTARERRESQLAEALHVIAESLEPPHHYVDDVRDYLRARVEGRFVNWWTDLILGWPFDVFRWFWHYVVLEVHLFYNLLLLYFTVVDTPSIWYYVVGLTLFWIKILYELYRDILHRDDPVYKSFLTVELSLAAAICTCIGFIIKLKLDNGLISGSWWTGG